MLFRSGKATRLPAAVITSSGTAVANLMPAVIEAKLSHTPMLLLTADRPSELRQTGSNQTIDQIKIFGDYTQYFHDVPPPSESDSDSQLRSLLTMVDVSVRSACMDPAGPVHLNLQFREPLTSTETSSTRPKPDAILQQWWDSDQAFTRSNLEVLSTTISNPFGNAEQVHSFSFN